MRFLLILFWVVVAAFVTLFAADNWRDVTIDLWSNLQADVKIPVLLLFAFLLGFVPTWLTFRAKIWRLRNRVSPARPEPVATLDDDKEPLA